MPTNSQEKQGHDYPRNIQEVSQNMLDTLTEINDQLNSVSKTEIFLQQIGVAKLAILDRDYNLFKKTMKNLLTNNKELQKLQKNNTK